MRTRMSGGVRGVRSNAAPISIIVIPRFLRLGNPYTLDFYVRVLTRLARIWNRLILHYHSGDSRTVRVCAMSTSQSRKP